jgi:hypothetical protein
MKKLILGAATIAIALSLSTAAATASAKDRNPALAAAADMNKDGMVSKDEFLQTMAKMYDDKMVKMKAMPAAEQAKMMKDDNMTIEAFRRLLTELGGGGR